ncbi:MAG TPA: serine hydrolase domain-containing protein [Puia sp.]|nr:serine hydrolase domain-containing protein [Puia sp.]
MILKKIFLKLLLSFAFLLILFQHSIAQYNFDDVSKQLGLHQKKLGGNICAMIFKDGKIIYQKQIGNMSADKIIQIASCSKWLSAALVMTFVDEGKLSLEDTVGKFLPIFSTYGKGNIKIKNCLSHTTGIETSSMNLFSLLDENNFPSLEEQVNSFAKNKKMIAAPGTEFRYSSMGLNIASRVLEIISNKSFEEVFQERIAKPLDMNNTTFGKSGLVSPSGGANSTANDYMHFLEMILNRGSYNGKQVLSEKSVSLMQQAQTNLSMIKYAPKGAFGFNYACGEWIQEADNNGNSLVLTSPGFFGAWPYVDNKRNYAALFFVKKFFIDEPMKEIYLNIKKEIDEQIDKN